MKLSAVLLSALLAPTTNAVSIAMHGAGEKALELFSQKDGGMSGGFDAPIFAIQCYGGWCSEKEIWYSPSLTNELDRDLETQTPFFSEEGKANEQCPPGTIVSRIQCTGDRCDNMSLYCSPFKESSLYEVSYGDVITDKTYFSEEQDGTLPQYSCPESYFVSGILCRGGWCDNISFTCHKVILKGTPNEIPPRTCTANIWGDPHATTFDGRKFDAHPKGEAILVQQEGSMLEVQALFSKTWEHDPLPAVTTGVAIHGDNENQPTIQFLVGDEVKSGEPEPGQATIVITTPQGKQCPITFYVDCELQDDMSYNSNNDFEVTVENCGDTITVTYPGLVSLHIHARFYNVCFITMDVNLLNCDGAVDTVWGLLGSPNGNPNDDWMDREGHVLPIPSGANAFFFEPAFNYIKANWMVDDEMDSIFCHEDDFEAPDEEYNDEIEKEIEDPPACCIDTCGNEIPCLVDCVAMGCGAADEFKEDPGHIRPEPKDLELDLSDDLCIDEESEL